jgi:hypothetical protein
MGRPRKYATEEEREKAKYKQKLEYAKKTRHKYARTLAITQSPEECERQLTLLNSYGYESPAAFWRVCIKMLEGGLLPRNPEPPRQKPGAKKNQTPPPEA